MRIIPALIFLAFLSGSAPAQAQQDVPMPREVRVLVQKGFAFLGFEPGPADGVFGRRTRAAIRDWQAKNEREATGYLTRAEAETLTIAGMKAGQAQDMEMEEPAGRLPVGAGKRSAPRSNRLQHRVLHFPTCGHAAKTRCRTAVGGNCPRRRNAKCGSFAIILPAPSALARPSPGLADVSTACSLTDPAR